MTQEEALRQWFPDMPDAVRLCEDLAQLTQVWDDLVDGDQSVSAVEVSEMVMIALFAVRNNPFFRAHEAQLDFALSRACRDWFEANALEEEGSIRHVTFALRSALTPVIIDMAYIVHGPSGHAYALEIRKFLFETDESYDEYEIEMLSKQVPNVRLVEEAANVREET